MKVHIWDHEALEYRDSTRDYDQFAVTSTIREDYEDKAKIVHLYADTENGIVTASPEKYEAWLTAKGLN